MSTTNYASNLTTTTVAAGAIFSQEINGDLFQYIAGDTVTVPTSQYAFLQSRGILN
jgi:hypothetical protein